MSGVDNPFTRALVGVDPKLLRDSFGYCNRQPDLARYDRTTLGRWLAGSVPSRGDFVACLAERLDDLALYESWVEARYAPTAEVKAVVSRFRNLPADEKLDAFQQIRDDLIRTGGSSIRSRFSMRVELHDGPAGLFKLNNATNWTGGLPARATVVIATNYDELNEAFEQSACVFRDVVEFGRDRLTPLLRSLSQSPQLSYTPLTGHDRRSASCEARLVGGSVFQFDNPAIESARIMLRVSYPYPVGLQLYPIMFRSYQIAGTAELSLALRSERAHSPRGYAFLGSGRRWSTNSLGDEVVIEAGSGRALLGADTGIVLHWSERDVDDRNDISAGPFEPGR